MSAIVGSIGAALGPVTQAVGAGLAGAFNPSAIFTQLAEAGVGSVIVSGLQSQTGQNALDPLHLIFKPNTTAQATAGAPVTSVATPTATSAAFNSMPPAAQAAFIAAGGHVA